MIFTSVCDLSSIAGIKWVSTDEFYIETLENGCNTFLTVPSVHRWSGRGPVPLGGGASSTARELRRERGLVGTRLFISKETREDEEWDTCGSNSYYLWRGGPFAKQLSHRGSVMEWLPTDCNQMSLDCLSLGSDWVQHHLVMKQRVCAWVCVCRWVKRSRQTLRIKGTMKVCILRSTIFVWLI